MTGGGRGSSIWEAHTPQLYGYHSAGQDVLLPAVEVGPEARRPQHGHRSQTCKQFATDFQELGGLGS